MRSFLLLGTALLMAACAPTDTRPASQTSQILNGPGPQASLQTARVKAVLAYANWCSSCKILDPRVAAIKATADLESVAYIVLDYTRRDEKAFFAAADNAGVGAPVRAYFADGVETGRLLLIDAKTGEIMNEISKANTAEEIETALRTASA